MKRDTRLSKLVLHFKLNELIAAILHELKNEQLFNRVVRLYTH